MSPYKQREAWVASGSRVSDFQTIVGRELDRLASLEANWDAQGAQRIDRLVIEAARSFIRGIPSDLIWPPAVVPMAKGNLQLEWHDGPRSLELEFESPGSIHYLKWHPEEGIEEEGFFPLNDTSRAQALIGWFVGDAPHA